MDKGTQQIAKRLLKRIHTSTSLSAVSETLESITQNKSLKQHASLIVTDPHLSYANKRTQLLYLLRSVDLPLLNDFFSDELSADTIWLFHTDKIDYFDRFVQSFQRLTETVRVVHLVTVIPLSDLYLRQIADNFATSFGYQVIIDHEVNPSLIGGIQVRLDNYVFDYSLRSRFSQFQRQWVNSIQTLEDTVSEPPLDVHLPSS
jgi:F-type H+-transporting ATPase subunit delta